MCVDRSSSFSIRQRKLLHAMFTRVFVGFFDTIVCFRKEKNYSFACGEIASRRQNKQTMKMRAMRFERNRDATIRRKQTKWDRTEWEWASETQNRREEKKIVFFFALRLRSLRQHFHLFGILFTSFICSSFLFSAWTLAIHFTWSQRDNVPHHFHFIFFIFIFLRHSLSVRFFYSDFLGLFCAHSLAVCLFISTRHKIALYFFDCFVWAVRILFVFMRTFFVCFCFNSYGFVCFPRGFLPYTQMANVISHIRNVSRRCWNRLE